MPSDIGTEYQARLPLLNQVAAALTREVEDCLARHEHIDRISFRVKTLESFVEKAKDPETNPPYGNPLREIEDQVAGRVIVYFLQDLILVTNTLKTVFTTVEASRRRPKEDDQFGYESFHLICILPPTVQPPGWEMVNEPPTTFELQIRTLFMHAYAQPQHRIAYKGKASLTPDMKRRLAWVAASAWGAERFYDQIVAEVANQVPAALGAPPGVDQGARSDSSMSDK